MQKFIIQLCLLFIILFCSSCQEKRVGVARQGPDGSFLSPEKVVRLQQYCQTIADSADAGIAIADLRSQRVIVLVNKKYLVENTYKPASTFKVITAIASLNSNTSLASNFRCTGKIVFNGDTIWCWNKAGHGVQTLSDALKNSCNCYFAALGSKCSSANVRTAAQYLGYGAATIYHVSGERNGALNLVIPDEDKVLFALGHSTHCEVTGLQLLQLMSILATKGRFFNQPKLYDWDKLSPVYRGIEMAVISGTAERALVPDYPAAGKTGTLKANVDWDTRAWFCGFAPYDDPEVAIVVFCNHGTGALNAAPLAGYALKKISDLKKSP